MPPIGTSWRSGSWVSAGGWAAGSWADAGPAGNLFVDSVFGSDAWTRAQVIAGEGAVSWQTLTRAVYGSSDRDTPNASEAAQAGDVCIVSNGPYTTTGTDIRYGVAYNPVNDGASGNPITFTAFGDITLEYSSGEGPMIGAKERSYIHWTGNFIIDAANAPAGAQDDGAAIWIGSDDMTGAIGNVIDGATLLGVPADYSGNYSGIRIEGANNTIIRNVTARGWTYPFSSSNASGITVYWNGDLLIEHCWFDQNGIGIYVKAPFVNVGEITIRLSLFTNNEQAGITDHRAPQTALAPLLAYQNIFVGANSGFFVKGFAPPPDATNPQHAYVLNNAFYNTIAFGFETTLDMEDDAGFEHYNNIHVGAGEFAVNLGGSVANFTAARLASDRNVYFGNAAFGRVFATTYTLGSWQSTFSQDLNSSASDPEWVDPDNGDFHLQSLGQPALTLGRARHGVGGVDGTIIPCGPYIVGDEVIGPGAGPTPPPANRVPVVVANLRNQGIL